MHLSSQTSHWPIINSAILLHLRIRDYVRSHIRRSPCHQSGCRGSTWICTLVRPPSTGARAGGPFYVNVQIGLFNWTHNYIIVRTDVKEGRGLFEYNFGGHFYQSKTVLTLFFHKRNLWNK